MSTKKGRAAGKKATRSTSGAKRRGKAAPKGESAKDAAIFMRLSGELLARLDAAAERTRARMPGPRWSRSDMVRLYIERGLAQDETETSP